MHISMHIYTSTCIRMTHDVMVILIIPDTALIQPVFASACACMCTVSTASSDAPSSTSTPTVSACPPRLAHCNAVLPYSCEQ